MKRTIIDASQLELEEKVVSIKRVTKVVKGGRNFRFTALVVVGDGNGHVGAGLGKAAEIPEAIRKGKEDAMKKLVTVARDENGSITHDFIGKFGSAEMLLKKAPEGTGHAEGENRRLGECAAGHHVIQAQHGGAELIHIVGQQFGVDIGNGDSVADAEDQQDQSGEDDFFTKLGDTPGFFNRLDHLRSPLPFLLLLRLPPWQTGRRQRPARSPSW